MRVAGVRFVLGLAALGTAVLSGACAATDEAPPRPTRGSIGEETYGVLCDRIGAQALTEDLSGASFRRACHRDPVTGAFADHVDESVLPGLVPGSDEALAAATRKHALARIDALTKHRADLITALDAMFPSGVMMDVRDGEKGCDVTGQRAMADELALLLSRMTDAYADGTVPQATRALARVMDAIKVSPEAQTALANLDARQNYRPSNVALGLARPLLAYPRLRELGNATLKVISPDADPYAVDAPTDASGARIPVPGPAYASLKSLVDAAALELHATTASPTLAPPTRTVDPKTGLELLSRRRTKLEVLAELTSTERAAFGSGAQQYLVKRDARGVAQVLRDRTTGAVLPPFVDSRSDGANGPDGLADLNEFGELLRSDGLPALSPFGSPLHPEDASQRDEAGRPYGMNKSDRLYEYIDTSHMYGASLVKNVAALVDGQGKNETLMDALAGAYVTFGPRDGGPKASRTYEAEGGGKTTVAYDSFHAEQSPLVDFVYAMGQILGDPNADTTLAAASWLMQNREADLAQAVGGILATRAVANAHPEAALPAKSAMWDELLDVLAKVAAVTDEDGSPGLLEGLLNGLADDHTKDLGGILASFAKNKDELDYDRTDINGPPINLTSGGKGLPLTRAVDRALPDQGNNRSVLQRFIQLVHDTNGVEVCNRQGAQVKALMLGIDVSIPDNPLVTGFWKKSSFNECEVFHIQNMATFYMEAIVGKAQYVLRDKQLRDGIEFNLGITKFDAGVTATTVQLLETSSEITGHQPPGTTDPKARTGFWTPKDSRMLMTRPEWLNRNLFFPNGVGGAKPERAQKFSDALNPDHAGTAACPVREVKDPLPPSDPNYVPGGIIRLPACADGDWLDQRDPRTIFALETTGFYDAIAPIIRPFVDRHRSDLLIELIEVLHRHWADANVTASDCKMSGDPKRPQCTKDGAVTYEPILTEAFGGDVIPALRSIATALKADTAKSPRFWLPCASRDAAQKCVGASVTGTRALAYAGKALLDPASSAALGLTDRRGSRTVLRNDGMTNPQVTPMYLLVDALNGMDRAFESYGQKNPGDANRQAQWHHARSALVDQFLSADKSTGAWRFGDAALPAITPIAVDLLRQELRASCPEWPNASCAWAGKELAQKLESTMSGPVFAHAVDVMDAVRRDEAARLELEKLIAYMVDSKSGSDALQTLLVSTADAAQLFQDETNLVPLFHALASALGASKDDPAQRNMVDATAAMLTRLTGKAVGADGLEQCKRELDPNQVMTPVLQASVTPVHLDGARTLTPVEVILDTITDVNRAAPEQGGLFRREDYVSLTANVSDFLTNKESGLEQFYAIVKRATGK